MASGLISKLFGKESSTEEEIKQLVDEDEEKGALGDLEVSQREMINNIFEFDDINAGDIMTHRTDVECIDSNSSLEEVVELATKTGLSRIPVYEEDLDNIVGIIYVKDLLKFIGKKIDSKEGITDYLRKPLFVPETISCGKLFAEMTEKRIQLAVVVDEYGGTAGIVTMEDLLESIVGNIQDEYDDEDIEVNQINENTYVFDGVTDIEDVEKILGIEFPEGDYDTLAGFVINLLGYLPNEKEKPSVEFENLLFTVLKVAERRIELIKVEIN